MRGRVKVRGGGGDGQCNERRRHAYRLQQADKGTGVATGQARQAAWSLRNEGNVGCQDENGRERGKGERRGRDCEAVFLPCADPRARVLGARLDKRFLVY